MSEYSTDLAPVESLLSEYNIEDFTAGELTRLRNPDWTGPGHVCPPSDMVANMGRTIRVAQQIRTVWGDRFDDGRIKVVSGYRPPAYNDLIDGSTHSAHMEFRALDLSPYNGRIEEFRTLCNAAMNAIAMFTRTGFGRNYAADFVHIDIGHVDPSNPSRRQRRWRGAVRP